MTTTTPAIPVTAPFYTASKITLKITVPGAPLFWGSITISRATGLTGVSGNVSPGTAGHLANRTINAGAARFKDVHDLLTAGYGGFELNVTYDSSYNVTDFIFAATQAPAAAASG